MPVDKDDIDPSIEAVGDKVHRVVRGALGLVPGGGAAVELFNTLITPPLERRRQKWMTDVTESIQALEAKEAVDINDLFDDDEFVSTLMQASAAAIKSHEDEKLTALKSAVLNSAQGQAPEYSKREIYLRYVSELTVWHLRVLSFFDDPEGWHRRDGRSLPTVYTGSRSHMLEGAFSKLKGQRAFYDQLWRDLYARGLVNTESLHTMMTGSGVTQSCTTASGRRFVQFITQH